MDKGHSALHSVIPCELAQQRLHSPGLFNRVEQNQIPNTVLIVTVLNKLNETLMFYFPDKTEMVKHSWIFLFHLKFLSA